MFYYFLIFFSIFSFFLIYISKKFNLFIDYKLEKHKRFSSKQKSYSIGGIMLIIFFAYYFLLIEKNFFLFGFIFSIFIIGLFSDLKKLNSVNLRFALQIFVVLVFVYLIDIKINFTRIEMFDEFLQNNIFINLFFTSFCLLIALNGGNFIDGINGIILKYYILVYLILYFGFPNEFNVVEKEFLKYLIITLSFILILNLSGFLYMGDSGAYLISVFTGFYLINFSSQNFPVSPYLIILLIWYPCFELLFSMVRRYFNSMKTYKPDNQHLHYLIYTFFKTQLNSTYNLMIHFITSLAINLYNLVIFLFSLKFKYNSQEIIFLIIFNVLVYILLHKFLSNNREMKNNGNN